MTTVEHCGLSTRSGLKSVSELSVGFLRPVSDLCLVKLDE